MKHRLWVGAVALLLLAACGGTAEPTSTATTPATTVAVAPAETVNAATPTMVVTAEMTAASVTETPTVEATTDAMEVTVTSETTGMMDMTAEATATGMMDMTAEATTGMMDVTAEATTATVDTTAEATPATEDATAAPAVSGDSDARQAILDAMRGQLTGGPFRSETTIESSGQTYTVQSAFVPPSRMQATTSVGGVTNEVIVVDDTMWTKTGDQWTEVPGGAGQVTQMMNEMVQNPDANGIQINNAQAAGTEEINGATANVYTYDSTYTTQGQTIATSGKIWIDAATGRAVRLESTGEMSGVESKTVQVITYDDSITVEPPTP